VSIISANEPLQSTATFGSGGDEPYAAALRRNDLVELKLQSRRTDAAESTLMDVARWNAEADIADLTLLRAATGPLLDIGCGPGRMVHAAQQVGLDVLGIDVSPTAIAIAREAGLPVIQGSIFDAVPHEGEWQTLLLVDGNIGIGGDVSTLLRRCMQLVAVGGDIVVELHPDRDMDDLYTAHLVGADGGRSESFPWAQIGINPMVDLAIELGLRVRQAWELGGRTFCRLATTK
jgi:SAM-dependent methyltransferase